MTPEQLKARNEAIRRAYEDPLRLALLRKDGSKRSSREAYNSYYRAYRKPKLKGRGNCHTLRGPDGRYCRDSS